MNPSTLARCLLLTAAIGLQPAFASVTSTLGNDSPGFNDGDTPTILDLIGAQGGQPAPFDQAYGSDVLGTNFTVPWTHSYTPQPPLGETITAASISIGIVDHDSAAAGNQVALFVLDGLDLTADLNVLFNAPGEGADGQYDVYTLNLPASLFTALGDGSASASLALAGPGLSGTTPQDGNGAHLIYSALSITTAADTPPGPGPRPGPRPGSDVPVPSVLWLLAMGLGLLGLRHRMRR